MNRSDDDKIFIILGGASNKRNSWSFIGIMRLAFKIMKYGIIFLIILFLYQRLPDFIANAARSINGIFKF